MSLENDFIPFAVGSGASVVSQATYAAGTTLTQNGYQAGLADQTLCNKTWRQGSIMAAVIGLLINNQAGVNAIDDGTITTLEANLEVAIKNLALIAVLPPAFRYPVPILAGYGTNYAFPATVADVPVAQFSKTTPQSVSWGMPGLSTILVADPIYLRLHFTGNVSSGNFYLQFQYQIFAAGGALSPATYTTTVEAVAAPTAGDLAVYRTAVMVIPANAVAVGDWINCVLTRLSTNVLDTNTGAFQLINVTMEQ